MATSGAMAKRWTPAPINRLDFPRMPGVNRRMDDRWVTFDCYGTLIDWNQGFHQLLEPSFGDLTGDLIQAYHVHERLIEAEQPHRLYRDVIQLTLSQAARSLGLSLAPSDAVRVVRGWGTLAVFPDVEPMLAALRSQGIRIGVLTNCDNDLFAETQRRFSQPFDQVITAEQVGSYKPQLGHFRRFKELVGASERRWVHVACSWFHDVEPASRLGIHRIWLDREHRSEGPEGTARRVTAADPVADCVAEFFNQA